MLLGHTYYSNWALIRWMETIYVDWVISITHGHPRRHIWTFVPALADTNNPGVVPPFMGNDYLCDIGHHDHWQARFCPDDPLWNVRGCGFTAPAVSTPHPGSIKNYPTHHQWHWGQGVQWSACCQWRYHNWSNWTVRSVRRHFKMQNDLKLGEQ